MACSENEEKVVDTAVAFFYLVGLVTICMMYKFATFVE